MTTVMSTSTSTSVFCLVCRDNVNVPGDSDALIKHCRATHQDTVDICLDCHLILPRTSTDSKVSDRETPLRRHQDHEVHKCRLCISSLPNVRALRDHHQTKHHVPAPGVVEPTTSHAPTPCPLCWAMILPEGLVPHIQLDHSYVLPAAILATVESRKNLESTDTMIRTLTIDKDLASCPVCNRADKCALVKDHLHAVHDVPLHLMPDDPSSLRRLTSSERTAVFGQYGRVQCPLSTLAPPRHDPGNPVCPDLIPIDQLIPHLQEHHGFIQCPSCVYASPSSCAIGLQHVLATHVLVDHGWATCPAHTGDAQRRPCLRVVQREAMSAHLVHLHGWTRCPWRDAFVEDQQRHYAICSSPSVDQAARRVAAMRSIKQEFQPEGESTKTNLVHPPQREQAIRINKDKRKSGAPTPWHDGSLDIPNGPGWCDECGKETRHHFHHMRKKHGYRRRDPNAGPKGPRFTCPACSKTFSKDNLSRHRRKECAGRQ